LVDKKHPVFVESRAEFAEDDAKIIEEDYFDYDN